MIPTQQLIDGVTQFAVNDVIPSMPNGVPKFLAYAAVGAMKGNSRALLQTYFPVLKKVGIMQSDDVVDEVALKNALTEAFANVPNVQLFGFTFDSSDTEKLYRRIGI